LPILHQSTPRNVEHEHLVAMLKQKIRELIEAENGLHTTIKFEARRRDFRAEKMLASSEKILQKTIYA
jgi:rRNA pseudouridine-1189 N-methylase Emg1 (Nep1/Mra1 family)